MIHHGWRRFKPHRIQRTIVPRLRVHTALWKQARAQVDEMFPGRQLRDDAIARAIQSTRDKAQATNDPVTWCVALILQAPRAAAAQDQMDHHPRGYHNREARLFELIDFNDTYVSAVLSLPNDNLPTFADDARRAMDAFCTQVRTRSLSNEQYEAIVSGLSREIAVFRGVLQEGFDVRMTSRVDDALGIDMVITDRASGRSINVDCKTHSAFYYRLKDLTKEGRLTIEQMATAEDNGYCWIVNKDGAREERIALWRIDEQTYGNITNFSFESTTALAAKVQEMLRSSTSFVPLG